MSDAAREQEMLVVEWAGGYSEDMRNPTRNPYFDLHRKFRQAGAEVLLSSGQACVALGIAAFSKDGDWIVREDAKSCLAMLNVLSKEGAGYRLGVPLDPQWLALGQTSRFEYRSHGGMRIRVDICSRPPRVPDIDALWSLSVDEEGLNVVNVESLIRLKQTRRIRDYSIIGALAEAAGLGQGAGALALAYLQDYTRLAEAVRRWPEEASLSARPAVRLLRAGADRREVVTALALEQDEHIQADEQRIAAMQRSAGDYPKRFAALRAQWRRQQAPLFTQHGQLKELAACLLPR